MDFLGELIKVGGSAVTGNPLGMANSISGLLSNLLSGGDKYSDWKGWDDQDAANGQWLGSTARGYVLDGDDPEREAKNISSYIKSYGIERLTSTGHSQTVNGKGWRDVTMNEIVAKLKSGGATADIQEIKSLAPSPLSSLIPENGSQIMKYGLMAAAALLLLKFLKK